ncbi:MAG TPA: dolichyl-phosphate beta-glucosyltransferase [Pirellulales bacterium]|jgi:dolichyl-phosphate beta-glucosyltransferase|nr:dolichyl-phosphate beta-glucosyltransferase [Pirellulales bacterium]
MQLSIIIPAYNEEQRLPRTLSLLEAFFHGSGAVGPLQLREVVVVDDGSRDATSSVVRTWRGAMPLRLIRLEKNSGKGAASRAGMLAAVGDCCLLYDADAATPVSEIPKLAARMCRDRADLVIGSRVRGRKHNLVSMQWHRRLIGSGYHWLCSALIPGIDDAACGAKLFTRRAAQDLFSRQRIDRFAFDIEVLSMALRRGYTICEMAVRWEAVPGSKVNLLRDTLNMSWCVLKLYVRQALLRDLNDRGAEAANPYGADLMRPETLQP